jgi:hypothetical protein
MGPIGQIGPMDPDKQELIPTVVDGRALPFSPFTSHRRRLTAGRTLAAWLGHLFWIQGRG